MSACEKSKPTTKRNRRVSPTVPFVLSFSIDVMLRRMTASFSAHNPPVQPPTAMRSAAAAVLSDEPPTKSMLTACSIVISPSYADSMLFCANKKRPLDVIPPKDRLCPLRSFFVQILRFSFRRKHSEAAVRRAQPSERLRFPSRSRRLCSNGKGITDVFERRKFVASPGKKPFIDFPWRQSFHQTESMRFRHGLKFFRRKTAKARAPR